MTGEGQGRAERIAAELARAPKYRRLCADTLLRTAEWACVRYRGDREAVKAAKRKLHQVYGAYLEPGAIARVTALVQDGRNYGTDAAVRAMCHRVLSCHASTAERVLVLDRIYRDIFEVTTVPRSVLDLACGLHPFAIPWMHLPEGAQYTAMDIGMDFVAASAELFRQLGGNRQAEQRDVLVSPPQLEAELVFLLKAIPCLEQQVRGSSVRLLRALQARHAVVSFPTRSLGGRGKGMEANYSRMAEEMWSELGVDAQPIRAPNELFYVVDLTSLGARQPA